MKMMEYGLMQWLGVLRSDKCWLVMYVLRGGAELCAVGWVLRLDERTKNGAYLKQNCDNIMKEKKWGMALVSTVLSNSPVHDVDVLPFEECIGSHKFR